MTRRTTPQVDGIALIGVPKRWDIGVSTDFDTAAPPGAAPGFTQYQAAMSDAANAMDKAGLAATGAVQQRINDLITIMPPNPRDMMLSTGKSVGQEYNTSLDRVSNACDAENATIELTRVTLSPF